MEFRHVRTKAVRTATGEEAAALKADPDWVRIAATSGQVPQPADPTGPESLIQDAPSPEPIRDLSGLDRDQLLAFAAEHGIEVNRRLGDEKLAEQIIAARPIATPPT